MIPNEEMGGLFSASRSTTSSLRVSRCRGSLWQEISSSRRGALHFASGGVFSSGQVIVRSLASEAQPCVRVELLQNAGEARSTLRSEL